MISERLQAAINAATRLPLQMQDKVAAQLESAVCNAVRDARPNDPAADSALNDLYRYTLARRLPDDEKRKLTVIMKNPSTATEERDDQTVRRVKAWAWQNGYGSIICVNLFARRATDPHDLNGQPYPMIVGPENDWHILEAAAAADALVAGWGKPNGIEPGVYSRRIAEVLRLLGSYPLHVVGPLTQGGYPRHGRWWNPGYKLEAWRPAFSSQA